MDGGNRNMVVWGINCTWVDQHNAPRVPRTLAAVGLPIGYQALE